MKKPKPTPYRGCNFIDWRKARKTYECRDCGKLILKGDRYLRSYGKCDFTGDWMDVCYCEKCGEAFIFCEVDI